MSEPGRPGGAAQGRELAVPVSAVAWLAVAALFVLMRLGPVWQAPVGGAELVHLSGAWQAREGIADPRFVPTLFQALSTLLLHWSTSEVPSRVLAFLATATLPGALYFLRPQLGNGGALLALLFLAFDGPVIALGVSASAMAFDLTLAAWLLVALARPGLPAPAWAGVAFLVSTGGPATLPLIAAAALLAAIRPGLVARDMRLAWAGAGALAGVTATTLRFGLGVDGLRIAPFDLFAAGFEEEWSTATALESVALYTWPLAIGGIAAGVLRGRSALRERTIEPFDLLLLLWGGAALLWFLLSLQVHSLAPVVALSLPLALHLGPAAARAVDAVAAMKRVNWRLAGGLLGAATLLAMIATMNVLKWANRGDVGSDREAALVAGLFLMAAGALAFLVLERRTAPALLVVAAAAGGAFLLSASMGIALSGREEPVPSPLVAPQAPTLRRQALEVGHRIAVHPDVAPSATWIFRGVPVEVMPLPGDADVLVWPASLPQPQGWAPLEGSWALEARIEPATGGALDYIAWLVDRNHLNVSQVPVSVFVRASE